METGPIRATQRNAYPENPFDKAVGLLYNQVKQSLLLSVRLRAGHEKKIPGNRFWEDNKGVPFKASA